MGMRACAIGMKGPGRRAFPPLIMEIGIADRSDCSDSYSGLIRWHVLHHAVKAAHCLESAD